MGRMAVLTKTKEKIKTQAKIVPGLQICANYHKSSKKNMKENTTKKKNKKLKKNY